MAGRIRKRNGVVVSIGSAVRLSPSARGRQVLASEPRGCAAPGALAESRGSTLQAPPGVPGGADFVGWEGGPSVPDRGGVLEGGACPHLLQREAAK
jgi:hypothetical protein